MRGVVGTVESLPAARQAREAAAKTFTPAAASVIGGGREREGNLFAFRPKIGLYNTAT